MSEEHAIPDSELVTTEEAAEILTRNANRNRKEGVERKIPPGYVRHLAEERYGSKLTKVRVDGRTNKWIRSQVEAIEVADRPGRKKSNSKQS